MGLMSGGGRVASFGKVQEHPFPPFLEAADIPGLMIISSFSCCHITFSSVCQMSLLPSFYRDPSDEISAHLDNPEQSPHLKDLTMKRTMAEPHAGIVLSREKEGSADTRCSAGEQ